MTEIKGINLSDEDPKLNAVVTFFAFVICGVTSLLPCIFSAISGYDDIDIILLMAGSLSILTCFILG